MFGYVRAVTSVLPEETARQYEAVYCGLCRTLGTRYGWSARLILSYDSVFLAILLASDDPGPVCSFCRCPLRPWRKKACWMDDPALETAADESVILTWWKLQDALLDGRWWQRLGSRLLMTLLGRHYRAAVLRRPGFDETVRGCLDELHQMEAENLPSLDRPADAFARILPAAAVGLEPAAKASGISQILYHVGRWIYLTDAWDDLEKDRKEGTYNPLLARFGEEAESSRDMVRETLHASLGVACTALALLDWGTREEILSHILGTGLPAVEEAVFTGQWKKRKK